MVALQVSEAGPLQPQAPPVRLPKLLEGVGLRGLLCRAQPHLLQRVHVFIAQRIERHPPKVDIPVRIRVGTLRLLGSIGRAAAL